MSAPGAYGQSWGGRRPPAAGRAVATVLMLGGIVFFSGVTANLAPFLVRGGEADRKSLSQLMKEVEALRGEISKLHESGDH